MLQFIVLFLAINCLFIVARYTSRLAERQMRSAYWYLKNPGRTAKSTGKVLPREHLTVRQMLVGLFQQLEDETGEKGQYELLLWTWYNQNVSEAMRARASPDSLPHWLEQLAAAYNNFWIYNGALLCVFFALTVGIMCCWGAAGQSGQAVVIDGTPPPAVNGAEARQLAISGALGYTVHHCEHTPPSVQPQPTGELCYIEETELDQPECYVIGDGATAAQSPLDGRYLWDTEGFRFYAGGRLIHSGALRLALERLHQQEQQRGLPDAPCVCPLFLGMAASNLTLLYRNDAWLVMPRPTIQRVNTLASAVVSQLRYHYNSQLFDASQRIGQRLQLGETRHYNIFIVEYDQPLEPPPLVMQSIDKLHRVRELEPRPVLLQRTASERARIQLTGDDAICYIYCDTMNAKLAQQKQQEEASIN